MHDLNDPGVFVGRHPFFYIIPNIVRVEFGAFFEDHHYNKFFAETIVGNADYGDFQKMRDLVNYFFNFSRIDVLFAPNDKNIFAINYVYN